MSIALEHVNYIYSPGTAYEKRALNDISLEIGQGQFVGIIGHTGSGKSTLIQHLNGLNKPSSGKILYKGQDISEKSFKLSDLRKKVGLVFQYPEYQLFETTVLLDVAFGPKNLGCDREQAEQQAREALALVGLPEECYEMSPFELSGGQKRKAAIAGVLAMNPEVLILDEPTAALDPYGRDEILAILEDLHHKKNITILLVSHSMDEVARFAQRIIVMDKGEVLMDGTPADIFRRHKELEEIGLAAPQAMYIMKELITLGQYYPADSIIHRLDPRVKLLAVICYTLFLFINDTFISYLLNIAVLTGIVILTRVPFRQIVKGIKSILFLLLFSVVFTVLFTKGEDILFEYEIIVISVQGLLLALKICIRIFLLIMMSTVLTLSTTPTDLADRCMKLQ